MNIYWQCSKCEALNNRCDSCGDRTYSTSNIINSTEYKTLLTEKNKLQKKVDKKPDLSDIRLIEAESDTLTINYPDFNSIASYNEWYENILFFILNIFKLIWYPIVFLSNIILKYYQFFIPATIIIIIGISYFAYILNTKNSNNINSFTDTEYWRMAKQRDIANSKIINLEKKLKNINNAEISNSSSEVVEAYNKLKEKYEEKTRILEMYDNVDTNPLLLGYTVFVNNCKVCHSITEDINTLYQYFDKDNLQQFITKHNDSISLISEKSANFRNGKDFMLKLRGSGFPSAYRKFTVKDYKYKIKKLKNLRLGNQLYTLSIFLNSKNINKKSNNNNVDSVSKKDYSNLLKLKVDLENENEKLNNKNIQLLNKNIMKTKELQNQDKKIKKLENIIDTLEKSELGF